MTALTLTVDGGIARVTLAQPAIRNAFSDAAIAEITAAFLQVGDAAFQFHVPFGQCFEVLRAHLLVPFTMMLVLVGMTLVWWCG